MLAPANIEVVKIMTKTRLERKMVRALNDYSTIELIDVEQKGSTGSSSSDSQHESELLALLSNVTSTLDILGLTPDKTLVSEKRQFSEGDLQELVGELTSILDNIFPEIEKYRSNHSKINNEINDLKTIKEIAERLKPLGLTFDLLHEGSHFYLVSGLVKESRITRIDYNVKELTNNQYFLSAASLNKNESVVVVGVLKKFEPDLTRILTSFGFSEFEVPKNVTGDPNQILVSTEKNILEKEAELSDWEKKRIDLAEKHKETLVSIFEQLNIEKERLDARKNFRRTDYTVELWGFVPKKQKQIIENIVLAIDPESLVLFEDPHFAHEDYPTLLENNKLAKPFESLVYAFGAPTYKHDWDPTLLMMVTFPLFFGMMFGDVGHGLMVLVLAILGFRFDPNQGGLKGLLAQARAILLAFSISAIFFGLMFGSFLGLEGTHSPIPALWFSPEEHFIHQFEGASGQFALLQLSFIVGNLHIISGLVLMSVGMWKHHERVKMLFFPVFLLLGYICALILIFTYSLDFSAWFSSKSGAFDIAIIPILGYNEHALLQIPSALIISIPMLLIFITFVLYMLISERMNGVSEAIDFLLTLLSNSVSYARLFAVLIVHGILARLFMTLAGVHAPDFGEYEVHSVIDGVFVLIGSLSNFIEIFTNLPLVITLLLGAALVMSLELLITTIQAIRLHWVEWFSKMHYQGSGHQFNAFKANRRFTKPSGIDELTKVLVTATATS